MYPYKMIKEQSEAHAKLNACKLKENQKDVFIKETLEVLRKIDSEAQKSSTVVTFAARCLVLLKDIRALLKKYRDIDAA